MNEPFILILYMKSFHAVSINDNMIGESHLSLCHNICVYTRKSGICYVMDRPTCCYQCKPSYNGDFVKALQSIKALACIMPGSTDLFCTADDNEYEAKRIPHAVLKPIQSMWGHFSSRGINSTDNQFIDDNLKHLLSLDITQSQFKSVQW